MSSNETVSATVSTNILTQIREAQELDNRARELRAAVAAQLPRELFVLPATFGFTSMTEFVEACIAAEKLFAPPPRRGPKPGKGARAVKVSAVEIQPDGAKPVDGRKKRAVKPAEAVEEQAVAKPVDGRKKRKTTDVQQAGVESKVEVPVGTSEPLKEAPATANEPLVEVPVETGEPRNEVPGEKTGRRVVLTDDVRARLQTLLKEGKPHREIIDELDVSESTIFRVKRALGLLNSRKKPEPAVPAVEVTDALRAQVTVLSRKGLTPKAMAEALSVPETTILQVLTVLNLGSMPLNANDAEGAQLPLQPSAGTEQQ